MNQMTNAIKEAGIPIPPANKRIWLWVKDHPEKCSADIAKALGMKPSNVSALLGDMFKRDMLKIIKLPRRVNTGYGATEMMVMHYSVHPKMRGEYELLPLPKKPKPEKKVQKQDIADAVKTAEKHAVLPQVGAAPGDVMTALDAEALNALEQACSRLCDKLGFKVTLSQTVLWMNNNVRF